MSDIAKPFAWSLLLAFVMGWATGAGADDNTSSTATGQTATTPAAPASGSGVEQACQTEIAAYCKDPNNNNQPMTGDAAVSCLKDTRKKAKSDSTITLSPACLKSMPHGHKHHSGGGD